MPLEVTLVSYFLNYFIINNINIIAMRSFELRVLATKHRRLILYTFFKILSRVEFTRD
jgi:hypothetical protein